MEKVGDGPARGRRWALVGLLVLNAALAGALAWQRWGPEVLPRAHAQGGEGGAGRARGTYTMLAGRTSSGGPEAIYVVDSTNQEMVVLRWDSSRRSLAVAGYRNLQADASANPGR